MRLLFLAPFGSCHKQTVQRRLLPLARAMVARGHAVTLLLPPWDCANAHPGVRVDAGVQVRTLAPGPGRSGVYPLLPARLLRAVSQAAPDVLLGSKGLGYAGWVMRAWQRKSGRVLLDVDDLEDARGWGASRPWGVRQLLTRQMLAVARAADGVIAASRFLQQEIPARRSLYLPNGLDRAKLRARVEENDRVVLLLARGNDVDARRLAAVWQAVLHRVGDAKLVVAGDWTGVPATLPRVSVRGWLDRAELVHQIREAALCFFLPDHTPLLRAKSPARLLDCMAQGVPVLTLAVGEYATLAREGGGILAVDEMALAAKMADLLLSPRGRAQVSARVWQRARALAWGQRASVLESWLSSF